MAGLAGPPGQTATSDAGLADRGDRGKANHRGERLRERTRVAAVYIHLVWVNLAWVGDTDSCIPLYATDDGEKRQPAS